MRKHLKMALVAATFLCGATAYSTGASAEDTAAATLNDIQQTFGFVPTFMKQLPKAGFAGSWQQLKELEFSEGTALSPKVKALIGLAVVAQIPCAYCIWADAAGARQAGATDEKIGEAVAIAATERYWSTMLNGLSVDLATFKNELGPVLASEGAPK